MVIKNALIIIALIAGSILLGLWIAPKINPFEPQIIQQNAELDSLHYVIDSLESEEAHTKKKTRYLERQIQVLDHRIDRIRRDEPRRDAFDFGSEDTARSAVDRQLTLFRDHLRKRHARDSNYYSTRRIELRDSLRRAVDAGE